MPTNTEFLNAIFGEDAPWAHVTDFPYDPNNIPANRHLAAWCGDYFSRYMFRSGTNQYFTISNFYADSAGKARRRKALYRHTRVVVLDDVKEKLSLDEVTKLPDPSWVLETSPGSEQWGYILNQPCTERAKIENLLDGLVANGLAPEGKDPGMKGVTRYVRLPDGYNTKASKMVNGEPFKCRMLVWQPFMTTTLEDLAKPFRVDLDAPRREQRTDGAAAVDDHPLLAIPDLVHIKEVRSEGRFDITCPWVEEHTGCDDSGSAVFTNSDGSIGFKCHHGACQERTGRHLLQYVETQCPGFINTMTQWQVQRHFAGVVDSDASSVPVITGQSAPPPDSADDTLKQVLRQLRAEPPVTEQARELSSKLLQCVDTMPEIQRVYWHDQVRDAMRWSKPDFKSILQDLRQGWYVAKKKEISFFDDTIFVAELNQFFDRSKRIFYSPEAYQNTYAHLDADARKEALQGGLVTKVDRLDYAPKNPPVFREDGVLYGNSWSNTHEPEGVPGDVRRWLDHWNALGWKEHMEHMLQWMAFTLRHPEQKINHMMLLGSLEGCGKDFLLYPLQMAMGENALTISGEELLSDFNDYLLSVKYLHVNETELGDRREATAISNRLKPLAAAPPHELRVNQKGIKPIKVRNIVNCTMTTNSQLPIKLNGPSRRIFAVWSDLNIRDEFDETTPEWMEYWEDRWSWMKGGGWQECVHYLRYCVSLQSFNPGATPPVTEFLRDIRDASKSNAQQTIEAFREARVGAFAADLATTHDLTDTLRAGDMVANGLMYVDAKYFTPSKVNELMKTISGITRRDARSGASSSRVWVLRGDNIYQGMTSSQLHDEYARQIKIVRSGRPLTVVR